MNKKSVIKKALISLILLCFFINNTPAIFAQEVVMVSDITKNVEPNNILNFSKTDFLNDNSKIKKIKLLSLPSKETGQLKLYGKPISVTGQFSAVSAAGLSFEAEENFLGTTSFNYCGVSGGKETTAATVTVQIKADQSNNNSPIAADKSVAAYKNLSKKSTLSASDADGDELTYEVVSNPKEGKVAITDKNNGEFIYTPKNNYVGQDDFTFIAKDKISESNTATVSVNVMDKQPLQNSAVTYYDLYEHWAEYSAVKLYEKGILVGERVGKKYFYYPNKNITRMEFLEILMSSFGKNIKSKNDVNINFADAAYCQPWMIETAKLAYEKGILSGKTDENGSVFLYPNENITRAEVATMLNSAISSSINTVSTVELNFNDKYDIPSWATQAIKNLEAYGILKGYSDNSFKPYKSVTKAECGEMIYQAIKLVENGENK